MVNCSPHHPKLKCPVKTSDLFPNNPIRFGNKSFQLYLPICLYMCRKFQEHRFVTFYALCLTRGWELDILITLQVLYELLSHQ